MVPAGGGGGGGGGVNYHTLICEVQFTKCVISMWIHSSIIQDKIRLKGVKNPRQIIPYCVQVLLII